MLTQVEENVPLPNVHVHFVERVFRVIKALVHLGSASKSTVVSVSPAVIAALDSSRKATLTDRTDAGTTVAADVVKSSDAAAVIANYDDAFARDLAQKVVPGGRDLMGAPGADPRLRVEALEFAFENFRISVVASR